VVGRDDLEGLLQSKQFYDSVISDRANCPIFNWYSSSKIKTHIIRGGKGHGSTGCFDSG